MMMLDFFCLANVMRTKPLTPEGKKKHDDGCLAMGSFSNLVWYLVSRFGIQLYIYIYNYIYIYSCLIFICIVYI